MKVNEYQYYCSNKILKSLNSIVNDNNLSSLSIEYDSLFDEEVTINPIWSLISTSLLMSENFYKYEKSYQLISDDAITLIRDSLYLYPIVFPEYDTISPCLLDEHNHIADSYLHYLPVNYSNLDNYNEYIETDIPDTEQLNQDTENNFETKIKNSYGCNESIIENDFINIRKFIERTRNALAHSNYEVLDENNIRLYHYNQSTKKLDFNVILDPNIIVFIVDELNEIANEKYTSFMESYVSGPSLQWLNTELNDSMIKEYILLFDILGEEDIQSIINEINQNELFTSLDKENQFIYINNLIYDVIKPSYDAGIIINDYLYCNPNRSIEIDTLYEKYGIFQYLNSNYYNTSNSSANDRIYTQNKFKFFLLTLLECSLLTGYNLNENKEISPIDFSKMKIDDQILELFLIENGLKSTKKKETLEQAINKNNQETAKKNEAITKKTELINKHKLDNNYFNVVLPSQIKELEREITKINNENINNTSELEKIKIQGAMYNYEENLSHFILNHLRNSLAHGYIKFNKFDMNNVFDMNIIFEDYNPHNKSELTFKGNIKLGNLLQIITNKDYIQNIFGNVEKENDRKVPTLIK